jgi:hypothetical protein
MQPANDAAAATTTINISFFIFQPPASRSGRGPTTSRAQVRLKRFAIPARKAYLDRMSWHLCFDEPIALEGGTALASLRDAIAYLAQSIPETEHLMKEVQAAAHCVAEAAENGGPLLFARIGMM